MGPEFASWRICPPSLPSGRKAAEFQPPRSLVASLSPLIGGSGLISVRSSIDGDGHRSATGLVSEFLTGDAARLASADQSSTATNGDPFEEGVGILYTPGRTV